LFLDSEVELPLLSLTPQIGDVLNDPRLLVVGFFDDKGVVLNALRRNLVAVLGECRFERQDCGT
jgi:hypothetical protein